MSESKKREQRQKRVFWNDKERKTVINAAVLNWFGDTEHVWCHIAKGQEALEPDRRRPIQGKAVVTPEILEMFEEARAELLGRRETETPPEVPAPTPIAAPAPAAAPIDRAAIIANASPMELFEALAHQIGPFIAGFNVFTGILKAHIHPPKHPETPPAPTSEEVTTLAPAPIATAPAPLPTAAAPAAVKTPPRKKVLLFGFSKEQEQQIKQRAGNFDLELLWASQPEGGATQTIPPCDKCIVHRAPGITLSRRATAALAIRPGNKNLINAGKVETVLKELADLNSRR